MTKTRMIGVACVCVQLFALHAGATNETLAKQLKQQGESAICAKQYALSISYQKAALQYWPAQNIRERGSTHVRIADSYWNLRFYQKSLDHYTAGKLLIETLPNSQELKYINHRINGCLKAIQKGVKPEPTLKDVVVGLQQEIRKLKKALENQGIVLDDDEKMKDEKVKEEK